MKIKSSVIFNIGNTVEVIVPVANNEIDSDNFNNAIDIDLSAKANHYISNITGPMTLNLINAPSKDAAFNIELDNPQGYNIDLSNNSLTTINHEGNPIALVFTNDNDKNLLKVTYTNKSNLVYLDTALHTSETAIFDSPARVYALDGTGRISHGDVLAIDREDPTTIEFWAKVTNGTAKQTIIAKKDIGGIGYAVFVENNKIGFELEGANSEALEITADTLLVNGTWTHIVVTKGAGSDAADIAVFINGAASTLTTVSNTLTTETTITTDDLTVGASSDDAERFTGSLDNIRMYDEVLTQSDANNRFLGNEIETALKFHIKADGDDTGENEVIDHSDNQNHGSILGGVTISENVTN